MKFFAVAATALLLAAQVSLAVPADRHSGPSVACFKACYPKPHQCPKGYHPTRSGKCWTCCKSPKKDDHRPKHNDHDGHKGHNGHNDHDNHKGGHNNHDDHNKGHKDHDDHKKGHKDHDDHKGHDDHKNGHNDHDGKKDHGKNDHNHGKKN